MAQSPQSIGTAPTILAPSIILARDLVAVPWANGGGVTRTILDRSSAEGGPLWRLSLATIDRAGPFSPLPGLVRHFALVEGQVTLDGNEAPWPVKLGADDAPFTFDGADAPAGIPHIGSALALNFMVAASANGAGMLRLHAGSIAVDGAVLVFALQAMDVRFGGDSWALTPHDTLLLPSGKGAMVGAGCLVAVLPCA